MTHVAMAVIFWRSRTRRWSILRRSGLYLHACIAVDADDGALLGLAGAQFLQREAGRKDKRHALPIHAKESQRWLDGADNAARPCAGARELTLVADRESDIYVALPGGRPVRR